MKEGIPGQNFWFYTLNHLVFSLSRPGIFPFFLCMDRTTHHIICTFVATNIYNKFRSVRDKALHIHTSLFLRIRLVFVENQMLFCFARSQHKHHLMIFRLSHFAKQSGCVDSDASIYGRCWHEYTLPNMMSYTHIHTQIQTQTLKLYTRIQFVRLLLSTFISLFYVFFFAFSFLFVAFIEILLPFDNPLSRPH